MLRENIEGEEHLRGGEKGKEPWENGGTVVVSGEDQYSHENEAAVWTWLCCSLKASGGVGWLTVKGENCKHFEQVKRTYREEENVKQVISWIFQAPVPCIPYNRGSRYHQSSVPSKYNNTSSRGVFRYRVLSQPVPKKVSRRQIPTLKYPRVCNALCLPISNPFFLSFYLFPAPPPTPPPLLHCAAACKYNTYYDASCSHLLLFPCQGVKSLKFLATEKLCKGGRRGPGSGHKLTAQASIASDQGNDTCWLPLFRLKPSQFGVVNGRE